MAHAYPIPNDPIRRPCCRISSAPPASLPVVSPRTPTPGTGAPPVTPIVLALRPRFADAILDGTKTVELRRTRIAVPPGTRFLLYASSPVMAVVGITTLAEAETCTPARVWRRHRHNLGLSRAEYDAYLEGATLATALSLTDAVRLPSPHTLASLREQAGFRPPQSYRYLTGLDPVELHRAAAN